MTNNPYRTLADGPTTEQIRYREANRNHMRWLHWRAMWLLIAIEYRSDHRMATEGRHKLSHVPVYDWAAWFTPRIPFKVYPSEEPLQIRVQRNMNRIVNMMSVRDTIHVD